MAWNHEKCWSVGYESHSNKFINGPGPCRWHFPAQDQGSSLRLGIGRSGWMFEEPERNQYFRVILRDPGLVVHPTSMFPENAHPNLSQILMFLNLFSKHLAPHWGSSYKNRTWPSIPHCNSGQLRGDLVAEAEKPPLPWELTRLGAHAALRTKQMAERSGALRGATGLESFCRCNLTVWQSSGFCQSSQLPDQSSYNINSALVFRFGCFYPVGQPETWLLFLCTGWALRFFTIS